MKKLIVLIALFFSFVPREADAWWGIKDRIYRAAKAGDTRAIESYLMQGYSIDEKDADGNTALCTASWDYSPYAYDLLISYGANPKAECMLHTEDKVLPAKFDYDGYKVGGGIALLAGTAAILAGGSGSGGDDPEPEPEPEKNTFKNDREFNASNFSITGVTNFLASINADGAFSRFYTIEDDGNITTTLSGTSSVGIVDTGVDGGHSEFNRNGGSKVSGYNFDYGPCFGEDHVNCWMAEERSEYDRLYFYDEDGLKTDLVYYVEHENYLAWKAAYPENYDWDEYKNRADSFYPITGISENPLNDGSYAHGTHIAGIIGANHDQSGMMGVAFTNTDIKAVRWDFMSSLYEPIKTLVDSNTVAINFSIGSEADEDSSSYDYGSPYLDMMEGWKEAAAYTMSKYDYSDNYKDGTIWVKAAGNDSYRFPDLESGIKLISTYSNLMMLVVVSADVTLNDDGTINTYSLSDFSNKCANTSGYCIAAPGNFIASTNIGSGYIGMSGTSMAAPVVTGAIAFLKNAFPNMRSEQIIDLLMSTANKNASDYDSSTYGAGLLDLTAALEYQSPVGGTSEVMTVSGNSLDGSYVRLDNAFLVVSSPMAQALQKALPEKITAFDAYGRAYDYPTANYIKKAHSGYKNLKNDVAHIIPL
ncbi:MAG: S8 family serine peptidase, partial [Alphaproteobacteria bacterium]|nr:S8 family serine peptidase [Alphaproteobacteria bacterium]